MLRFVSHAILASFIVGLVLLLAPAVSAEGDFSVSRVGDWGYSASHPAGIEGPTTLRVSDASGVIHVRDENSSPYCAFGDSGPHATSCYEPRLDDGTYTVEATFTANDGSTTTASDTVVIGSPEPRAPEPAPAPATPEPTPEPAAVAPPDSSAGEGLRVNAAKTGLELDGQPFQVVGLRVSNALISDQAVQQLVDNMDTFGSYGINAFSVFFQGSRFGDIKGYNEDATLNATYAARMARIIEAADSRGMVVLVGILYHGGSEAKWESWGQAEANRAVANTVRWLRDHGYRNVFIDVNNESMAPFDDSKLIAAGKAVDASYILGASGWHTPDNADVSLHFGDRNIAGKPYIESEGTPDNYWGDWTYDFSNDNYKNVGVYTESMKQNWLEKTTRRLQDGDGYMGASTWLQAVPPRGPNMTPGGDGTQSDPGIKFWLEHVRGLVDPAPTSTAPDSTSSPTESGITVSRTGDWGYTASHPTGIDGPTTLRVSDGSRVIASRDEYSSPYCAFGDPGLNATACHEPDLDAGSYEVEAVITANDGSQSVVSHEVVVP